MVESLSKLEEASHYSKRKNIALLLQISMMLVTRRTVYPKLSLWIQEKPFTDWDSNSKGKWYSVMIRYT